MAKTIRTACPISIFLLALALPACYTILKHPRLDPGAYDSYEPNRCYQCHSEDDLWRFHHRPGSRLWGRSYYDPWGYYYDTPWWYDYLWYYEAPEGTETVPLHRRSLRPRRSREKSSIMEGGGLMGPGVRTKSGKAKSREAGKAKQGGGKTKSKSGKKKIKPKRERKKDEKER